ncbi:hypothetical protein QFC21_006472 [Naganishia friedmannii]|uniref:Uncharacterized protein n=1 Tax=Naganishia friedmannii TaxID=89922 RepID=A0ACC2V2A9_9TREE|nr:hypothetical protein QFC21_006472 [Naganishia friedmannii]
MSAVRTRSSGDASPASLQAHLVSCLEEIVHQKSAYTVLFRNANTIQNRNVELEKERDQLKADVDNWKKRYQRLKQELTFARGEPNASDGDESMFLGIDEDTEDSFVSKLQGFISSTCLRKAMQKNWTAANLLLRITQPKTLEKARDPNPWNKYIEWKTHKVKDGVDAGASDDDTVRDDDDVDLDQGEDDEDGSEGLDRALGCPAVENIDPSLREPAKKKRQSVKSRYMKKLEGRWKAKTPQARAAFLARWKAELDSMVKKAKLNALTPIVKRNAVEEIYEAIAILSGSNPEKRGRRYAIGQVERWL